MKDGLTPLGQIQDLRKRVAVLEQSLSSLVVVLTAIGILGETDADRVRAELKLPASPNPRKGGEPGD